MSTERLTTLTAVKEWLSITTDGSDTQLLRLIDAASQFVLNWMNRPTLRRATYIQRFKGGGKSSVLLGNWPVLSVGSVTVGSTDVAASTFNGATPSSGYFLPTAYQPGYVSLELAGYGFLSGGMSQVVYDAGFETYESDLIPAASGPYILTPTTGGMFAADLGVAIDGVAATRVASAPATGEYAVGDAGVYTFAAADAEKLTVMTYSYVPYDIMQSVTDIVGEWTRAKDHIGLLSKTLGGQETVTFTNRSMGPIASASLQPYKNVVSL